MRRPAFIVLAVAFAFANASVTSTASTESPDALTSRITHDLPGLRAHGIAMIAPEADGAVVLHVTGDVNTARRDLTARYGERVRVVPGQAFRPLAGPPCLAQRTHCGPVMRGGLELIGDTLVTCTSGVEARLNRNGEIGVITAGHCFRNGQVVTHGGMLLGPAGPSTFSGGVDGAFVTHSLGAPTFLPSNWVYYSGSDREHAITAVQSMAAEKVGQSVCRTGRTTSLQCGTITSVNATIVIGAVTLTNQRVVNVCALPGDSGGPFLSGGTFRGIVSAGNYVGSGSSASCHGTPFTTYSPAERIQSVLGVTVLTSSPLF
ncbi:MAG TPA: S1 family peptidase [Actinomycetota bacterium]|nr:S1 family peptidase [Actinomycetota bacterium]